MEIKLYTLIFSSHSNIFFKCNSSFVFEDISLKLGTHMYYGHCKIIFRGETKMKKGAEIDEIYFINDITH